jgi:structural maintenance of chromosome 1
MEECRLLRINVRDFKSFRGDHLIGPFSHFSGVIGPNGSGKSNVLDAPAFCLYLDSNPRSENYIHRPNDGSDDPTSCSVGVTLEVGGSERTFTRQEGDETILYLNGDEIAAEDYRNAIAALRITPLSFVKQSEVDAIARKSPVELAQFFEEMSGSVEYPADYDRYRLESESTHEAVNLIEKRRRAALSEKRHISVRIDEAARFRELSENEEHLQIEAALYQLFHYKRQLDEATEESNDLALRKHDLASESENIASNLHQLQRIANETRAKHLDAKHQFDTIEQQLREVRASQSMKREACDILGERVTSTQEKRDQHQNAVQEREQDLARMRHERELIETEIAFLPRVDEFETEISEYNTLRERASQQFSDVTQALRAAVHERNAAQRDLDDCRLSWRVRKPRTAALKTRLLLRRKSPRNWPHDSRMRRNC